MFDRTTRRVELTPAGRALLGPAAAILRMGERARSDVQAAHRGDSGHVRFSFDLHLRGRRLPVRSPAFPLIRPGLPRSAKL